jgi:hypothetical protein
VKVGLSAGHVLDQPVEPVNLGGELMILGEDFAARGSLLLLSLS